MTDTSRPLPKLMLVGHGRAGKDEAGEYLARITPLRFAGTTSKYLAKYVVRELGGTEEQAYRDRHQNRDEWYRIGNELRANDPGILIRESLQHGEIIGGIRDMEEVQYARREGIVDLIVWIENLWVPFDPTVKFTSRECDLVLQNNWDLAAYHERLRRLADCLGIRKTVAEKTREASNDAYGAYLARRGWMQFYESGVEYWLCQGGVRSLWPADVRIRTSQKNAWSRDEALALEREIDASKPSVACITPITHSSNLQSTGKCEGCESGHDPATSGHELEQQGKALGKLNV